MPTAAAWALLINADLIWSGVALGCACSTSATAPETTAAACEVPLPRSSRSVTPPESPYCWSMNDPATRRLGMCTPGATKSGLR